MESHVHSGIHSQIGVQTPQRPEYPHPNTAHIYGNISYLQKSKCSYGLQC
jgi:hypothetical protein